MKYHAENRSVSYVYCNSRYFTVMAMEKNFKDDYWISKEKRLQT